MGYGSNSKRYDNKKIKMDKLVTIAIASYNNAPYIERCIDSVVAQSYGNLEVLVVDDGSTDDTLKRIERYSTDKRVCIIKKENGGLSSVRQLALDKAIGEYICFIDADDYLAPTYVEYMIDKLINDKSDICVCGTQFVDSHDNQQEDWTNAFSCINSHTPYHLTPEVFASQDNKIFEQIHLSDSWNKMYNVPFLKKEGVRFSMEKGLNGTDTLFNGLVALHSPRYSTIENKLYCHVIYDNSAVHRKNKNLLRSYQIIAEKNIEESKKLGIYEYTFEYIAKRYQNNLLEVLIDEFKEKGFFSSVKRFHELRKINRLFIQRVDVGLNRTVKSQSKTTKTCNLLFNYAPLILLLVFQMRKLTKH